MRCVYLGLFKRELSVSKTFIFSLHLQHYKGELAFWPYQGRSLSCPELRFSSQLSSTYL